MKNRLDIPRFTGVHFRTIGKHLRSVYQQLNGEWELADVCTCRNDWKRDKFGGSIFTVIRDPGCTIDEHRAEVIAAERRRA